MLMSVHAAWGACALLAVLIVSGCGSSDTHVANRPQVVPVSGVVKYNGESVAGATVTFQPKERDLPAAFGKTDGQGRFRLRTFGDNDGAVPGEHAVMVSKYEVHSVDVDPDSPDYDADAVPAAPPPKALVPEKYTSAKTSGLTASVSAGQENDVTLELVD